LVQNGRVSTLDAVRGIAIISMVIGHVANFSFLWRTSHFPYYVWDGASLFMLVSGIVVGIVYRKRVVDIGMRGVAKKLLRRAGMLYVAQLALVAFALTTAYVLPTAGSDIFLLPGVEDYSEALLWAIPMAANPIYVNFLSTYVVVLIAAIPALWLLHRRRYAVFAVAMLALYAAGLVWPDAFTLPNGPLGQAGFDIASWFALFMSGLATGWWWRDRDFATTLTSQPVLRIAIPIAIVLLAIAAWDAAPDEPGTLIDWLTDKDTMAPLRVLAAWSFFIVLYWLATVIAQRTWGRRLTDALATLGAKSLDAIVILTTATITIQGVFDVRSESHLAQILALVVIAVAWAWAQWRITTRSRRVDAQKAAGPLQSSS
jgi:hypothetical protein